MPSRTACSVGVSMLEAMAAPAIMRVSDMPARRARSLGNQRDRDEVGAGGVQGNRIWNLLDKLMLQLPGSGRIDSTPWCWSQGAAMDGFTAFFEGLDDPRTGNAGRHDLLEMLMIALCTVLSGGEDCTDMAEFARTKLAFLRGFLKLEHGAPSHDTFSRLFRLLDPEQFRDCFQRFMARFAEACHGVVAIDGKVLRRSF